MPETRPTAPAREQTVRVRPLDELDISGIVRIDERISGLYRPDFWENRVMYYLRRDSQSSQVAEAEGRVVGFMLADVRAGAVGRVSGISSPVWADLTMGSSSLTGSAPGRQPTLGAKTAGGASIRRPRNFTLG